MSFSFDGQTAYTIVRILQRFERIEKYWDQPEGAPLFKSEIVLSPASPVTVGFWEAKG